MKAGFAAVLGMVATWLGLSFLDERCEPTGAEVTEWLTRWQALPTIVLDENDYPGGFGAGMAVSLPPGYTQALLIRSSGEWLTFHEGIGWTPADGYKDDYCANRPPGAHLAPDDSGEVPWESPPEIPA